MPALVPLDGIAILSVDLFDTLLLRGVERPDALFRLVGARALAAHMVAPHITPEQFHAMRTAAESSARVAALHHTGSTEITLHDIYLAMPARIFIADRDAVAALEVAVERERVFANPAILELIADAKRRSITVVAVSDTYFTSAEIASLLDAAGVPSDTFAEVIISSAAGCSKHDGALFDVLLAKYPDTNPHAVLHLGDHERADVTRARAAGLRAHHYDTGANAMRDIARLETLRHGSVLPEIAALRRLACTLDAPPTVDLRWCHTLGAAVVGPTLAAFADWVVQECVRDGITTIRPLLREGALVADLLTVAADAAGATLDIRPLHASRAAAWLAGLERFDDAALQELLQRRHLTVREAFRIVGLDVDACDPRLGRIADTSLGEASCNKSWLGRTGVDLVASALSKPFVRRRIDDQIAAARQTVSRYLDFECGGASRVAITDLGFHGSTGRSLARATAGSSPRTLHQFLVFGAESLTRAWTGGADIRVFAAGPGLNADLAGGISRHPAALEALLVEGRSTLRYELDKSGQPFPVLDDARTADWQRGITAACRSGVRTFQRLWIAWRQAHPDLAAAVLADRRGLTQPIHRLITFPSRYEAEKLGSLLHEDNEGGHSTTALVGAALPPPQITADQFLDATASGSPAFGWRWLWPAGTCEQKWPGHLERIWHRAAATVDGAPPAMPRIAMRMREAGLRTCILWGAGEAGLALARAVKNEGIEVLLATDSNPALWGTTLDGVPVVSPDTACERRADAVAIGSCAFASEIEATVRRRYADMGRPMRIYSAAQETAA